MKNGAVEVVKDKFKIELVPLSKLKPFENNPRIISKEAFEKLCTSIKEDGFVENLVIDEKNRIIGGYQRSRAAKKVGLTEVPCHRINLKGDERRAKILNLRLNRIHGDFDYELLFKFMEDLDLDDVELAGFDANELEELKALIDEADSNLEAAEEEADNKTRVSFDADLANNKIDFKFGGFKTKVKTEYQDRFVALFETMQQLKVVTDEPSFVRWVIQQCIRASKNKG